MKLFNGALDLGVAGSDSSENNYRVQSRPAGVELVVGPEEAIRELLRAAWQEQRGHLLEKVEAIDRKLAFLDELP
jgi:hypothetical protein